MIAVNPQNHAAKNDLKKNSTKKSPPIPNPKEPDDMASQDLKTRRPIEAEKTSTIERADTETTTRITVAIEIVPKILERNDQMINPGILLVRMTNSDHEIESENLQIETMTDHLIKQNIRETVVIRILVAETESIHRETQDPGHPEIEEIPIPEDQDLVLVEIKVTAVVEVVVQIETATLAVAETGATKPWTPITASWSKKLFLKPLKTIKQPNHSRITGCMKTLFLVSTKKDTPNLLQFKIKLSPIFLIKKI